MYGSQYCGTISEIFFRIYNVIIIILLNIG